VTGRWPLPPLKYTGRRELDLRDAVGLGVVHLQGRARMQAGTHEVAHHLRVRSTLTT
jgi:hypothetical protein